MSTPSLSGQRNQLLMDTTWIFFLTSILHFLYGFTKFRPISYISAVNESVWEHTKITFFAALFYDLILYFKDYRGNNNFVAGLAPALFSIILSVPLLFYGYSGAIGFSFLAMDLFIAFLSALISQYILKRFTESSMDLSGWKRLSLLLVLAMIILFFIFTWYPPHLPLFRAPLRG